VSVLVEQRYDYWFVKTNDPGAAATLVLAEVNSAAQPIDLPAKTQPEYLTVKQAAKSYNLGERTIYRMVEDGLSVVRAGRAIRIKPRDLEKRLADSETILR
jgi:excisionase family DNA binding protein